MPTALKIDILLINTILISILLIGIGILLLDCLLQSDLKRLQAMSSLVRVFCCDGVLRCVRWKRFEPAIQRDSVCIEQVFWG